MLENDSALSLTMSGGVKEPPWVTHYRSRSSAVFRCQPSSPGLGWTGLRNTVGGKRCGVEESGQVFFPTGACANQNLGFRFPGLDRSRPGPTGRSLWDLRFPPFWAVVGGIFLRQMGRGLWPRIL